jgi:hypothetical protein
LRNALTASAPDLAYLDPITAPSMLPTAPIPKHLPSMAAPSRLKARPGQNRISAAERATVLRPP